MPRAHSSSPSSASRTPAFLGELEYPDRLFITDEDAAEDLGTSGHLEFEPDGSITIGHLLDAMITVSDNSSAVTLMHAFGASSIDQTLRSLRPLDDDREPGGTLDHGG
ncbi:MAG: serine hydrolase [Dehalococcoidia bacterium]|uniref:serine hydrolase n=1 Tax=Candidatus Amarobacter glycogenicus TaxID=3140699 RepID=UPI003135A6F8|nr:serine hydrolase [Dehalococcoidia bacterium]